MSAKKPQTFAKRAREQAVKEKRDQKRARKAEAAAHRGDPDWTGNGLIATSPEDGAEQIAPSPDNGGEAAAPAPDDGGEPVALAAGDGGDVPER
jgi:hypothetical protein